MNAINQFDGGVHDQFKFENGNWWNYSVLIGVNVICYQVANEVKEIRLQHDLFSKKEMYEAKRDSFLAAAAGLPVYLTMFKEKDEIRMTTYANSDFPEPCGVVTPQTAGMIVEKTTIGFLSKDGGFAVDKWYKEFVPQKIISRMY